MFADKVPAPTPAQLADWKKAHEKEIKDYFEANKFVYQQPERIHALLRAVVTFEDSAFKASAKSILRA